MNYILDALELTEDLEIFQLHCDDFDQWNILQPELQAWTAKWQNTDVSDLPKNALGAFNCASPIFYPNVRRNFQVRYFLFS